MRDRIPIVFSTIALLVAVLGVTPLGEAAYNALLPRNSVGTLQLKRNAVTSSKIAPNAVRTAHVLNGTLLVEDFKPGQIPQGPKGDKGDKGDKGEQGDQGDPGTSGYQIVREATALDATDVKSKAATCPTGKKVVGGSAYWNGFGPEAVFSSVSADGQSLSAYGLEIPGVNPQYWSLVVAAVCMNVTAASP